MLLGTKNELQTTSASRAMIEKDSPFLVRDHFVVGHERLLLFASPRLQAVCPGSIAFGICNSCASAMGGLSGLRGARCGPSFAFARSSSVGRPSSRPCRTLAFSIGV